MRAVETAQLSPGRRFLWIAAFLIFIVGLVATISVVLSVWRIPKDAYAMWGTGELLVEHLKRHENHWPTGWATLETTYRELESKYTTRHTNDGRIWESWDIPMHSSIEEMIRRVDIDWQADPKALAGTEFTNGPQPFRVVRLKNGHGTHYKGAEPNAMVWQQLRSTVTNAIPR